jgi:hypothetical protein
MGKEGGIELDINLYLGLCKVMHKYNITQTLCISLHVMKVELNWTTFFPFWGKHWSLV